MEIFTTIDIDASPETVWHVLTDFAAYEEWNPRTRISGTAAAGERLVVAPGPEAGRMPTFKPTLLQADPPRELRWLGHLYVRGLFDGEHAFTIEDLGAGRARLVQFETFSGVLARPLLRLFGEDTEQGFEAVNAALKARAEAMEAEPRVDTTDSPTVHVEGDGRSADSEITVSG